jgi:hypothetical protein
VINLGDARLVLFKVPERALRSLGSHVTIIAIVVHVEELMQTGRDLVLFQKEVRENTAIKL